MTEARFKVCYCRLDCKRFVERAQHMFLAVPLINVCSILLRFQNSRFYGPSVTSISSLIAPTLDQYVELIAFDFEEKPYVFSTARDATRCQTSSQWSAYCKAIFKKWSGVACPPKMLRASFVTWIRSTEASPEVLKQAARAMRHQKETVRHPALPLPLTRPC